LGATLAALALAAVATAALTAETRRFSVPGGETRTGSVECDRGKAAAGGFLAKRTETGAAMLPISSLKDGGDGWSLRASNTEQSGRAKVQVLCKRGAGLTTRSEEFSVPDDEVGSATPQCPAGQEPVAGGFDTPDSSTTWILGSRRAGAQGWRLTVLNVSGGGAESYTAYAYCDRSEPGLTQRKKVVSTDQNERFNQSAKADCGRKQVRSGGFEIEHFVTEPAENSRLGLVHASRRQGRSAWKVTAHVPLNEPRLTAYAYCG
jgi:hypothetical protein